MVVLNFRWLLDDCNTCFRNLISSTIVIDIPSSCLPCGVITSPRGVPHSLRNAGLEESFARRNPLTIRNSIFEAKEIHVVLETSSVHKFLIPVTRTSYVLNTKNWALADGTNSKRRRVNDISVQLNNALFKNQMYIVSRRTDFLDSDLTLI
ncbi:hypothetical protein TNCV_4371611 [Trichonephila clavipes]|nr:hypothetical protein TNCV_4371611 [Trichonephila clavipes]